MQFEPTESTRVELNILYSRFTETRTESWGEVLLRSNERSIDVVNPVYDGDGNMIAATLNDAWVRTEAYRRESKTSFYQVGTNIDQDVTDRLRFTLIAGLSRSNADIPVETTIIFDDRDAQGYSYDYSDMARPVLTFGTSVTTPSNFQLAEIRDRPSNVTNTFRTAQLRGEWDVSDAVQVHAGAMYRRFAFGTEAFTRDTVVCGNGGVDRIFGTLACSASSLFGPTAVYGFPVNSDLSTLFTLGNAGQPAGTTTQWLIPNIDRAASFTNLYGRVAAVDASNTRGVTEVVKGGYFQLNAEGVIFGMD